MPMSLKPLALLAAFAAISFAQQIPRRSAEFAIKMTDGKEILLSSLRGKVVCLTFIVTT
ncbi:MAG: hypothetical protein M3O35_03155 [Acidobacteriota bacterium]|nr:hypothetical protein [Acidobacteriota bacterium]